MSTNTPLHESKDKDAAAGKSGGTSDKTVGIWAVPVSVSVAAVATRQDIMP